MAYGIFTSGNSDVHVTAQNDVNIGGARIAAFNGGSVFVRSETGNVNAGNGANATLVVPVIRRDPATGNLFADQIQDPRPFGSGIITMSPTGAYQAPGGNGQPGNITVETPQGDIVSSLGGIQQFALSGTLGGGPHHHPTAGTPPANGSSGYAGNIDLGAGGVIGGTVNMSAQGTINGFVVSHSDANINAAGGLSLTLLSGGTANVSSGGPMVGTLVSGGGLNVSSGGGMTATLLGQNVSVGGGAAQSTLGGGATPIASSQAAAQQASTDYPAATRRCEQPGR